MIEIYAQSYNGQPATADLRCVFGPMGERSAADRTTACACPTLRGTSRASRGAFAGTARAIGSPTLRTPTRCSSTTRRSRHGASGRSLRATRSASACTCCACARLPTPASNTGQRPPPRVPRPRRRHWPSLCQPRRPLRACRSRRRPSIRSSGADPGRQSLRGPDRQRGRAACAIAARAHAESVALGPRARRRSLRRT